MIDAWGVVYSDTITFTLVFARLIAAVMSTPFFNGRAIPTIVKTGLVFFISILITPTLSDQSVEVTNTLQYTLLLIKEIGIGIFIGFICQMFFSVVSIAGEAIDTQLGLSMARVYDPTANASLTLTSNLFSLIFTTMFFVTNAHLTLIQIISYSFQLLPLGAQVIGDEAGYYIAMMFASIMVLALQLALPFLLLGIIVELGLGILMRTVPTINVFVVGMQLKLLVGFFILIVLLPSVGGFIYMTIDQMLETIQQGLEILAT